MQAITYGGWRHCYSLSNGLVDLVVTGDVGPRVIRFGFATLENEFREYDQMLGQTGGEEWRVYGGHRLWRAPEDAQRTYIPDNGPVHVTWQAGLLRATQPVESTTGIEKEIEIEVGSLAQV
jgi:hypothetical protein